MPRQPMPWVRLYTDLYRKKDYRRQPIEAKYLFLVCLMLARESDLAGFLMEGSRPLDVTDLADSAQLTEAKVTVAVARLVEVGYLEWDDNRGAWFLPGWERRQFESDDGTQRRRKRSGSAAQQPPVAQRNGNATTSRSATPLSVGLSDLQTSDLQRTDIPSSSVVKNPVVGPDDDEARISAAVEILARQDLVNRRTETGRDVNHPPSWMVTARKTQRVLNGVRLTSLALANRDWSPEMLAEAIEPARAS